jgi:hypothetical protein
MIFTAHNALVQSMAYSDELDLPTKANNKSNNEINHDIMIITVMIIVMGIIIIRS